MKQRKSVTDPCFIFGYKANVTTEHKTIWKHKDWFAVYFFSVPCLRRVNRIETIH